MPAKRKKRQDELDMTQMAQAGVSDSEIAEKLKMTAPELRQAWEALLERVHAKNRAEAIELVIARRILEAKSALLDEQAELALIIANHQDEAVLILNNMGTITGVGQTSATVLGRVASDLIGMPVDVLLAGRIKGVDTSSDEMARAQAGERVHSTRTHERDDGTTFEAEHTLIAIVGRSGEVSGFARDICDLTQRRIHEVRIEELGASVALLVKG
ncbi:MAG: PAS domain-containing protein [Fimbriimonas sp.]